MDTHLPLDNFFGGPHTAVNSNASLKNSRLSNRATFLGFSNIGRARLHGNNWLQHYLPHRAAIVQLATGPTTPYGSPAGWLSAHGDVTASPGLPPHVHSASGPDPGRCRGCFRGPALTQVIAEAAFGVWCFTSEIMMLNQRA